ncbi:Cat eye syndrome critical region protein 5 [Podospora australis]|uniref:Cat eye syndrome critical region protein 5 n=1 Tax=Podospora australis TaxID=1536484 RepID=A0AAN6WY25_9PEZI|nr:Cat eye syndrome critical region protein 5 [Podospora australis]
MSSSVSFSLAAGQPGSGSQGPQRPSMHPRQISSSSFANAFDAARTKLNELGVQEPEVDEDDTDDMLSPSSSSASDSDDDSPFSPSEGSSNGEYSAPASPISAPITPAVDPDVADNFAFAFDIDGVLVRGGRPIPEAIEAMKALNGENDFGIKVPYIFLTNGGGKFETERCRDLSQQLEIEVSPGQFICGHTPMRQFANRYGTVLIVGGEGETCRKVAEGYGFRDVITPGDIIKANAHTAPFRRLTDTEQGNCRDLLEGGKKKLSDIVVEAVFVFADSRDWASDLQIILDVAQSKGGRLETRSETFTEGPPIYFSHNDVLWSAAHEHVRLGMGALRRIVETVFEDTSGGRKLKTHAFGKPQVSTFEFATRLLQQWRATQHGLTEANPPRTVYFVGDTPESDIRGTNAMNEKCKDTEWYSILVKTGVYQPGTEPKYKPRKLVDTVLDAVNHGIRREMAKLGSKKSTGGRMLPLDDAALKAIAEGRTPNFELLEDPFNYV